MASYGFERVSSDDDLEEPRKEKRPSASPFNLSSSSYPATSRKSRREGSSKKPKPHEMKMVELKRNDREHEADDRRGGTAAWHQQQQLYYNNNPNNNHNYNDYDQQPQHYARPMEMDGGHAGQYRGPADFMEAATNAAAALGGQIRKMTATHPRRDYLYEGHGNERDHLLVPPTSPRYRPHSPSLAPPSSSAPSQSSATTFATFTTTTSVTYSSSSSSTFYSSSSALYDPAASSPLLSSPSSFVSLATSPPTMLLLPPPPPPLKSPNGKNKKRVTWVDESMVGTQLEEVIEVERYLKQRGSLGWWAELVWDNKPYFLLLLVIALLFLASVVFIVYKLVF